MMIDILLDRLARSRRIDEIVVATTDQRRDDSLAAVVEELGYSAIGAPKMTFAPLSGLRGLGQCGHGRRDHRRLCTH